MAWGNWSSSPWVTRQASARPSSWWSGSGSARGNIGSVGDPVGDIFFAGGQHPSQQGRLPDTSQPGFLERPGTAETWWTQNQSKLTDPGQYGQALNAATGRLMGRNYQPTNSSDAYTQMQDSLGGGPQKGAQNSWDISSALRNPTAGEGMIGDASKFFQGPNMATDYANQNAGFFGSPTDTQGYARAITPGLQTQGAGEQSVYGTLNQFRAPGAAEGNLGVTDRALSGIHYGDMGVGYADAGLTGYMPDFAPTIARFATSRGDTGRAEDFFMPGLQDKSYSEKLYESGNQGLDTFYAREEAKRTKALQDRAAASGMFGSGATLRGMDEIEADLGASQARDMASLAGQADQARLGRTGAAQSFAQAAGNESLGRMGLGVSGLTAADESARGNVQTMLGALGQASDEGLKKIGLRTDAAGLAQQSMIDRLFKGGSLGLSADQQGTDRMRLGLDAAQGGDAAALARIMGGGQLANAADQSRFAQGQGLADVGHLATSDELARTGLSSSTGLAADTGELARTQQLFGAAQGYDASRLAASQEDRATEEALLTAARNGDTDAWQRLKDQFGMSEDVQNLFQGRWNTEYDQQLALAKAKAGTYTGGTDAASNETAQAGTALIQNFVATGQISKEQGDQLIEEIGQGVGMGAQLLKLMKGG